MLLHTSWVLTHSALCEVAHHLAKPLKVQPHLVKPLRHHWPRNGCHPYGRASARQKPDLQSPSEFLLILTLSGSSGNERRCDNLLTHSLKYVYVPTDNASVRISRRLRSPERSPLISGSTLDFLAAPLLSACAEELSFGKQLADALPPIQLSARLLSYLDLSSCLLFKPKSSIAPGRINNPINSFSNIWNIIPNNIFNLHYLKSIFYKVLGNVLERLLAYNDIKLTKTFSNRVDARGGGLFIKRYEFDLQI